MRNITTERKSLAVSGRRKDKTADKAGYPRRIHDVVLIVHVVIIY